MQNVINDSVETFVQTMSTNMEFITDINKSKKDVMFKVIKVIDVLEEIHIFQCLVQR